MSYADFLLSYQTCPIVLVGGAAGTGVTPISNILNKGSSSGKAFGSFRVLPGGSLIDNDTAKYPLATMSVAANAVITNPLHVSIEMVTPANADTTLAQRQSTFTTLKNTLDNHIALGGYFNVATPAFIYTELLLLSLVDESDVPDGAQTQTRWVWNFEKPLISLQQAQIVTNNAMSRINGQTYNAGQPPGQKPLLTSVSSPLIGQQITYGTDNAAGATLAAIPISPSNASGTGGYV
jgi:hypothetical protein